MQQSRPPHIPPICCSSFKRHRSSIDHDRDRARLKLDLTLPKPVAAPVWASLPTPPMSGSPPPEPPIEPPQIAGRRRKRSPSPTSSATTAAALPVTSPVTPVEHPAPRFGTQTRGGETIAEVPVQPGPYALAYPGPGPGPGPEPGPASYQASSSLPTAGPDVRYALPSISPRSARKPKAHVASACINCKKKHLRCDNNRPCRRCVASGKENSCVDVEHKKRGRPPLKPEDPSARRAFESTMTPIAAGAGSGGSMMRRMPSSDPASFHSATGGPRTFRPLQAYDPPRPPPLRGPPFQSMYAQPTISPSPATALGTFVPSRQYPTAQPPGLYLSQQQQSESASRSMASYAGGYNYPVQGQMAPPPHGPYANPIFPRQGPGPGGESLPPLQGTASLQLPPIRPPPTAGPIDPAITQQPHGSPRREQDRRGDGTQEPDPKRPKMDIQGILGPRDE